MVLALPLRFLVVFTVLFVVVIVADVVLVEHGFSADAAALPILVTSLISLSVGQLRTHATVNETHDKVQHALNGGMEQRITAVLTRMAARDERTGTTIVHDAATNLVAQAQADGGTP